MESYIRTISYHADLLNFKIASFEDSFEVTIM